MKIYTVDRELARLHRVARILDSLFTIPGTKIRIGLENIAGFVPVLGDTLAMVPSLWIMHRAAQLGVTRRTLFKMFGNLMLDWLIGLVPLIGDLFDIGFNANLRNFRLIESDLNARSYGASNINVPVIS